MYTSKAEREMPYALPYRPRLDLSASLSRGTRFSAVRCRALVSFADLGAQALAVPSLRQVLVDPAFVNSVCGGLRVVYAGDGDAKGIGIECSQLAEEFCSAHPGHVLVGD